ncbi:MAG: tetratricopeptide repeat protein [Treponema sp.]|jgi:tetratricopeptide (TPR) repeat protein|nr:tetratricopeptide repeat protein [Treponema sp.]
MAATQDAQKKEEAVTINQKVTDFIQKNRKILFIALIVLVVALAGFITFVTVRDKLQESALSQVDEFSRRYDAIRVEGYGDTDPYLLVNIEGFAARNSGFAAARAYSLAADMQWEQNNFEAAERAWLDAAKAAGKNYLAPLSLYNAAIAAEERGNIETAIAHYRSALEYGNVFPSAVRAQFSIGRLEESRDRKDAALEAYRNVVNNWPNDPLWPNLAQSRILALSE